MKSIERLKTLKYILIVTGLTKDVYCDVQKKNIKAVPLFLRGKTKTEMKQK